MSAFSKISFKILPSIILLSLLLSACQTQTIEVTRVKIMERRVIEKMVVTVPVTRIHEMVVTATPLPGSPSPEFSPSPPSPTATPTLPPSNPVPTVTSPPPAQEVGEGILVALREMEQTLLSLVQALNSTPLPGARVLELYAALEAAPTATIPEEAAELQSIYVRYREQVDYVLSQSNDLRAHLAEIEAGEADQTEVSPTHLALAREAASAGTSTVQALIRELESYLAAQP